MTVKMTAHNNRRANRTPLLKNQCKKARKHKKKAKGKGSSHQRPAAVHRLW